MEISDNNMKDANIQSNSLIGLNDIKERGIKDALLDLRVSDQYDSMIKSSARENVLEVQSNSAPVEHDEIFAKLLNKIVKVDFRSSAGIDEKDKLKNSHYQIIAIEMILDLARKHEWNICQSHDFIYLFNGVYWKLTDEKELVSFLGKAAERMGVDKYKAKHYLFREQLLKQFISSASIPVLMQAGESILINLKNGTYEISSVETRLRDFDMNDFITYQLPFEYDKAAKAPIFEAYLDRVLPEKNSQMVLSEYLGYVFIPHRHLKLEKALLLFGSGANGKSVFFEVVNALLGSVNTSSYSLQSLTNENGYYRAQIANKLVNYASEINGKLETSIFKQLVSGEPVEARLPYKDPFIITKYAKLIFNCNELPRDVEHTPAFFRRFLIVPFDVTIPEEEQDKELAKKIIDSELSGVLNWVLSGLDRLLTQKGFTQSEVVKNAIEKYEKESDSVRVFLDDYGYKKDAHNWELLKDLYNEYRSFCVLDGYKPLNKTNFRKRLQILGYAHERRNHGNIIYISKMGTS